MYAVATSIGSSVAFGLIATNSSDHLLTRMCMYYCELLSKHSSKLLYISLYMYVIFCCSQQMANAGYNLPAQGHGYVMPPYVPPPYWMQQMFAQQMAAGRIPQPNMYMPPN